MFFLARFNIVINIVIVMVILNITNIIREIIIINAHIFDNQGGGKRLEAKGDALQRGFHCFMLIS